MILQNYEKREQSMQHIVKTLIKRAAGVKKKHLDLDLCLIDHTTAFERVPHDEIIAQQLSRGRLATYLTKLCP